MDFKDYINELRDLDNQEARTELKNIYILNSSAFNHFKSIDRTIQELLKQPCISPIVINQLKETIPALLRLKEIITELDSVDFAKGYKTKIYKLVDYINNSMIVDEVNNIEKKLQKLLYDNTNRYNEELIERSNQEKNEQEKKKREKHEAEKIKEINRLKEERENNREFQILFEYNGSKTRDFPIKVFLDNEYVATITPNHTFSINAKKGNHQILIYYEIIPIFWQILNILLAITIILLPLLILFSATGVSSSKRSIQFDINLNNNRKVGLAMDTMTNKLRCF